MQMPVFALLVMWTIACQGGQYMTGMALLLSSEAADNAAYAYNGTVASGTVDSSVHTGCGMV